MRLLLDTHAFLWWVDDDKRLSGKARSAIADRAHECLVSVASCWEIAIKVSLGKLTLRSTVEEFVPAQMAANGFKLLAVEFSHTARVSHLAYHHRNPFDRLLAAQAFVDDLSVVSRDPVFRRYGESERTGRRHARRLLGTHRTVTDRA